MAKKQAKRAEVEKIDFEAALVELEEIVHDLEDGETGLSESLGRYERGVKLLRQCYGMLDRAQRKIELLTAVDSEGRPIAEAMDDEELTLSEKADRRSVRRSVKGREGVPSRGGASGGGDVDESGSIT